MKSTLLIFLSIISLGAYSSGNDTLQLENISNKKIKTFSQYSISRIVTKGGIVHNDIAPNEGRISFNNNLFTIIHRHDKLPNDTILLSIDSVKKLSLLTPIKFSFIPMTSLIVGEAIALPSIYLMLFNLTNISGLYYFGGFATGWTLCALTFSDSYSTKSFKSKKWKIVKNRNSK